MPLSNLKSSARILACIKITMPIITYYSIHCRIRLIKGMFTSGAYLYGFLSDPIKYSFANGTVVNARTEASTSLNFSSISSSQDMLNAVDLPEIESTASSSSASNSGQSTKTKTAARSATSLAGYPAPIVMHPDGYVSGHFLKTL